MKLGIVSRLVAPRSKSHPGTLLRRWDPLREVDSFKDQGGRGDLACLLELLPALDVEALEHGTLELRGEGVHEDHVTSLVAEA